MVNNDRITLQKQLEKQKQRYRELMRGRMVPTSRAMVVHREIVRIEKEIKRLDVEAAERLAIKETPIENILQIVAIPLLADVMNDIVAGVDGMLREHGVHETIFGVYTAQIRKASLAMIDTLEHADEGLPRLLHVDDTLVDAVEKELMSFIKKRLNIKK